MTAWKSNFSFWQKWVIANALGELIGLGAVFIVGYFYFNSLGEPQGVSALAGLAVLVVLLAVYEGAVVGLAQWRVLRIALPELPGRSWILATVVGAVIAWVLGMIPSTLFPGNGEPVEAVEPPMLAVLGVAAAMGLVLGSILAIAQWWVLRKHVTKALTWLGANSLAWAVAMPLIFWMVGATIGEHQTPAAVVLLVIGIGIAGGVVGAIHGTFLVRMLAGR